MAAEGTAKMAAAAGEQDTAATSPEDPIVQYIVLRKDLWTEQGWPLGPLIAQACHASVAAVMEHRDDEATQRYCAPENIDQMTKVVLEAKGEAQLRNLAQKLTEAGVKHKLWIEQPENYPTCLAFKPSPKSEVAQYVKKFNLCKAAMPSK